MATYICVVRQSLDMLSFELLTVAMYLVFNSLMISFKISDGLYKFFSPKFYWREQSYRNRHAAVEVISGSSEGNIYNYVYSS